MEKLGPDESERSLEYTREIIESFDEKEHELLESVANKRRRILIVHVFHDGDFPYELSDLIKPVAAFENNKDLSEVLPYEKSRVRARIDSHVEKLDEADIFDYSDDSIMPDENLEDAYQIITRTAGFHRPVETYREDLESSEDTEDHSSIPLNYVEKAIGLFI